jgi:hypothetical protein
LLFAVYGDADVVVLLVIKEARAIISFRKAFESANFVLADSKVEVTRDADVERSGVATDDVGISGRHGAMLAVLLCWRAALLGRRWEYRQSRNFRGPSTALAKSRESSLRMTESGGT